MADVVRVESVFDAVVNRQENDNDPYYGWLQEKVIEVGLAILARPKHRLVELVQLLLSNCV